MSVRSEIDRIKENIKNAFTVLSTFGAEVPDEQTSDNLVPTAGTAKVLLYKEQQLTDAQKSQARNNIGAADQNGLGGTVEITSGEPTKEQTVLTVDPNAEEVNVYTAEEVDDKVSKLSQEIVNQYKATQDTAILGEELANANNWTLGTGWSGSFANGFTHASGNTEPLTFTSASFVAGKLFEVVFKTSVEMTTDNLFVSVGNSKQFDLYGQQKNGKQSIGVLAVDNTGLVFTPSSAYTGTITDISVKEITGSYEAAQQYFDTNEAVSFEIRVTESTQENVYIGKNAGQMNTSGFHNVALGADVLKNNTSGFWNVGIGKQTLNNNTAGSRNVGIGYNALVKNEVGKRNVAIGTFAMAQTHDGNWNIAIGADSMSTATSGDKNVGIGFQTLYRNTGSRNVAVGSNALDSNTSGSYNTAIGGDALSANTTGGSNVAVGLNAGAYITTGSQNTLIGTNALYKNKIGKNNVAIGFQAAKSMTSGNGNIVIGSNVDISDGSDYILNIGNLLKGSLQSGAEYLDLNGGLRLPKIGTEKDENNSVYAEEWTFTLEDGSTVTKKVLLI